MANNGNNHRKIEDHSHEELVQIVKALKKRKKFGLVWEAKPEDVVEQCKRELPVLEEIKDRAIENADDQPTNLIIEGDNYHALSVLNYTHAGKIDAIYIDPPYNTGARDWKYNNDYVDINDTYRHSKWLSMMEKRLLLAKNLLKQNGVLIVTIDDHELPNLTVLLNNLGAKSLGRATICIKPEGRRQSNYLMEAHEYALFVSWGKPQIRGLNVDFGLDFPEKDEKSQFRWEGLMRRDAGREDRGSDYWYPFYVGKSGELSVSPVKDYKEMLPINTKGIERVWLWDKERANENIAELKAVIRKEKITIYYKRREQGRIKPTTFWYGSKYNANAYGTRILDALLPGNGFDYPKSIYSVLDCIDLFTPKDGIVLDFFAGSGTTGHSLLLLNKEDSGSRRFILVTNNENEIAEKVTYPRIKKVIEGVRSLPDITKIPANVRYFKTAFVTKDKVSDDTRRKLVARSVEMICVRENTFTKNLDNQQYKIYTNGKTVTGILFNLDAISEFKKKIGALSLPARIYVFSLTNDTYADDFADLKTEHKLCPIPESILEVYRKIFA